MPAAGALVAGRLHHGAALTAEQVVKAALQERGAVVRPDVVALALVDHRRATQRCREVEDVTSGVQGVGRVAQTPLPGGPNPVVRDHDEIRFRGHPHKGKGGPAIARHRAVTGRDAGDVSAMLSGILVTHLRERVGSAQSRIDRRLAILDPIGEAGGAALPGLRGQSLVPDRENPGGAIVTAE